MKARPFKYRVISPDGTPRSRHRYRPCADQKARALTRHTGVTHKIEKIPPPEEPPAVPIAPEPVQGTEVPVTQITFLGRAILADDAMRHALDFLMTTDMIFNMTYEEFCARKKLVIAGLKRALGID